MAYMSQDKKKAIAAKAKPIMAKYGVTGTFGVDNHSTLVLNIKRGALDFIGNYNAVVADKSKNYSGERRPATGGSLRINEYWYKEHFTGKVLAFLEEILPVLNDGNHDNSDISTDYFDVGWYLDLNIGRWNQPYEYLGAK